MMSVRWMGMEDCQIHCRHCRRHEGSRRFLHHQETHYLHGEASCRHRRGTSRTLAMIRRDTNHRLGMQAEMVSSRLHHTSSLRRPRRKSRKQTLLPFQSRRLGSLTSHLEAGMEAAIQRRRHLSMEHCQREQERRRWTEDQRWIHQVCLSRQERLELWILPGTLGCWRRSIEGRQRQGPRVLRLL